MAEHSDAPRWHARIAHAVAVGTVPLQHASLAIGLIGVSVVAFGGDQTPPGVSLALSAIHAALLGGGLWLSLRLRIDAVLFDALAVGGDVGGFDGAMVRLSLFPADKVDRPMPDRFVGLMRLVRLLASVVAAQLVLLLAMGWLTWR